MRFQRNRAFHSQCLHQLANEEDTVEKILLLIFGSLEDLHQPTKQRLEVCARIADDKRTDRSASDDQQLMFKSMCNRPDIATGEDESTEHHDQQYNDTDTCEHSVPRVLLIICNPARNGWLSPPNSRTAVL